MSGSVLYFISKPIIPPGIKLIIVYLKAGLSNIVSPGAHLNYPDNIRQAKM